MQKQKNNSNACGFTATWLKNRVLKTRPTYMKKAVSMCKETYLPKKRVESIYKEKRQLRLCTG